MSMKCLEETEKHQQDLKKYLGLDIEDDSKEIVHMNHRFFKTFFPTEKDDFADNISFNKYSSFECLKLFGEALVELTWGSESLEEV